MQNKKRLKNGITLIEVLASIFVVSIGLLGVLAVIPFGAFQASKARHAEYASNMLANAAEEVALREMIKPTGWGFNIPFGDAQEIEEECGTRDNTSIPGQRSTTTRTARIRIYPLLASGGLRLLTRVEYEVEDVTVTEYVTGDPPIPPSETREIVYFNQFHAVNCTRSIWFEPCETAALPDFVHVFPLASFSPDPLRVALTRKWAEPMRGQDDLVYTIYPDQRPDFAKQNNKVQSSGKYTWFVTFLPQSANDWDGTLRVECASVFVGNEVVPLNNVKPAVDVLACYNRVPDDDRQLSVSPASNCTFLPSLRGGTFTLPNASYLDLLSHTKYVFVSWETAAGTTDGAWCKIVFVDKSPLARPKMIVTGDLPSAANNMHVYIPSGVLYRKRVENIPIN